MWTNFQNFFQKQISRDFFGKHNYAFQFSALCSNTSLELDSLTFWKLSVQIGKNFYVDCHR